MNPNNFSWIDLFYKMQSLRNPAVPLIKLVERLSLPIGCSNKSSTLLSLIKFSIIYLAVRNSYIDLWIN